MIPKAAAMIPPGEHEVKIEDDDFIGFIDLLAPAKTEQKLGGEHQVIPNVYDFTCMTILEFSMNLIQALERVGILSRQNIFPQ